MINRSNTFRHPDLRQGLPVLLLLGFLHGACLDEQLDLPAQSTTTVLRTAPVAPEKRTVQIAGWFTIIQNGETQYWLTDNEGQRTRLLLTPKLEVPPGGLRVFERKRIRVRGNLNTKPTRTLRVMQIDLLGIGLN